MNYEKALMKLKRYKQQHLLRFYNQIPEEDKHKLLDQISKIDFVQLNELIKLSATEYELDKTAIVEPMEVLKINETKNEHYYKIGIDAIKANKIALVLLAGGHGSRLGSNMTKGAVNIGETKEIYIFELLIKSILKVIDNADNTWIQLYIMTNPSNNDETISFLKKNNFFGYDEKHIEFFIQETLPSIDESSNILMNSKNNIMLSPNGNGGWLTSLIKENKLNSIKEKGIEWINVFSVDNVLQKIADPHFIGATLSLKHYAAAKVVKKATPNEKVGLICTINGKPSVIEYFVTPEEILNKTNENNELVYNYGVILNYLFNLNKLQEKNYESMPYYKVKKIIKHVDEEGNIVQPNKPNGYKFETLLVDMIGLFDKILAFEIDREKEFAPIKNKNGIDSIESAKKLLIKNGIKL